MNATGYVVYRSEEGVAGTYYQVFSGTVFSYQDIVPLNNDQYYWYNVAAFNESAILSGSPQMVYFPTLI